MSSVWISYFVTATAKSLQSCPTVCDPIPGILQARTGVGCHFLQCIKVKSESEVVQSCPTLRNPVDCSLPGSSIHGIFQARVLEWGAIAFSEFCHYLSLFHHYYGLNVFVPPPPENSRKLSDGFIREGKKVLLCNEMASNIYNCVTYEKKKESTVLGSVETEVNKF